MDWNMTGIISGSPLWMRNFGFKSKFLNHC